MQIMDAQRRRLSELIGFALMEIRLLGWAGNAQQAADLADAFHNLPKDMWKEDFSLEFFRDAFLKVYQDKYPVRQGRDYVALVNELLGAGEEPSHN
jgi:hypothetical protein